MAKQSGRSGAAGKECVIAPEGFMTRAVSENVEAGA